MKKIAVLMLVVFLFGCSQSPRYVYVKDSYNTRTYAPTYQEPQKKAKKTRKTITRTYCYIPKSEVPR